MSSIRMEQKRDDKITLSAVLFNETNGKATQLESQGQQ
uniref:Uncharacterized protein n=1 Tax=Heterorhabditis bacteriophora TaxID=37862 RepID=A0A1I7X1Y1_HETBA